jgi:uncharacterized protein (DUF885 family)
MRSRFALVRVVSAALLLILGFVVPSLFAQSSSAPNSGQMSSPELAKFFSDYFEQQLRDSPEYATTIGRHEYDDRWSDLSKEGRARRREHLEAALAGAAG